MQRKFYTNGFSSALLMAVCSFFFSLLSSCVQEDGISANYSVQYFNLNGFVKNEAERLSSKKQEILKTVFLNGKEEKKTVRVENWENELSAFLDADISRKSFAGKYVVEAEREDARWIMRYTALEENLRTRKLQITFAPDSTPEKIDAVLFTSNMLYTSHQQLTYEYGKGYRISGEQTIRLLEPDTFSVAATFLP